MLDAGGGMGPRCPPKGFQTKRPESRNTRRRKSGAPVRGQEGGGSKFSINGRKEKVEFRKRGTSRLSSPPYSAKMQGEAEAREVIHSPAAKVSHRAVGEIGRKPSLIKRPSGEEREDSCRSINKGIWGKGILRLRQSLAGGEKKRQIARME